MTNTTILVTGATGKTGASVVDLLRRRGFAVRAMVHQLDERSRHLETLGAEVVVGDFLDLASMRAAVKGVNRVYFCHPPLDGLLRATAHIAVAARDGGVEALVNMSQISAREGARSPLAHDHWLSEQLLDWAGVWRCPCPTHVLCRGPLPVHGRQRRPRRQDASPVRQREARTRERRRHRAGRRRYPGRPDTTPGQPLRRDRSPRHEPRPDRRGRRPGAGEAGRVCERPRSRPGARLSWSTRSFPTTWQRISPPSPKIIRTASSVPKPTLSSASAANRRSRSRRSCGNTP